MAQILPRRIVFLLLACSILVSSLFAATHVVHATSPEPRFDWVKATEGISPTRLATDTQDNLYIAGSFLNTVDFNPDGPPDTRTSNGSTDVFLTKFSADGTYQWTKTWGGTGNDGISKLVITSNGDIVMVGFFSNTVNFNPEGTADNRTSNGSRDIFFTKYSQNGTYLWTKAWGGTAVDNASGVTSVPTGDIAVVGYFSNTVDFNPDGPPDTQTSNGSTDVFLTKFSTDGTYQWTRTWGGTGGEYSYGVGIASSGDIAVAGYFLDTVNFNPGGVADSRTSNGSYDAYLTKFSSDGTYQWTKTWGGTRSDSSSSLTISQSDDIVVAGYFLDTVNFNPEGTADNRTSNGSRDIFLTKYSQNGTYLWTKAWGGTELDYASGITSVPTGDIAVVGYFSNTINFNPDGTADTRTSNGSEDVFLTSYSLDGTRQWTKTWGGIGWDYANDIALLPGGDIAVVGYFSNTVDFNPGSSGGEMTTSGTAGYLLLLTYAPGEPGRPPPAFPTLGPSGCTGLPPSGTPDLYQIAATDTTAALRFAPSGNPVTEYQVVYGYAADSIPRFGVTFPYGPTTGSIDYKISGLSPTTPYFFTVRAANGCVAGPFSNRLTIRTDTPRSTGSLLYYEYYPHVVRVYR